MKYRIQIILFSLLLLPLYAAAQSPKLLLELKHDGDLILKWYPTDARLWNQLNPVGYTVQRQQLSDSGQPTGSQITVAKGIMPKDSTWFREHGDDEEGYIGALGMLLYDPDFQYPPNDLMNADEVRYNYLLTEAQYFDNIAAEVLGLFFEDTTMVDGLKYRYTVSAIQNGATLASAQVDMASEAGVWYSSEIELDLELPNGQSISDMSGRLNVEEFDYVGLLAKSYGDSIVLRWGPSNSDFWLRANEAGYTVLRLVDGEWDSIDTVATVFPIPEAELEGRIEEDSFALVAAQMLYGGIRQSPEHLDDQAALLQNRFGMGLFAAERSPLAADVLGLRYVDTDVEVGRSYTYFVESPAMNTGLGSGEMTLENVPAEPVPPLEFRTESGDSIILLQWNKNENDVLFSSYTIERSEDNGKTFKALTKRPTLFLEDENNPKDFYQYKDSVGVNYKIFTYRLRGMTAFAEMSPPAEATGMGIDLTPPPVPVLHRGEIDTGLTHIQLAWHLDGKTPPDFSGFQVYKAENFGMEDAELLIEGLSATDTTFTWWIDPDNPPSSLYFQVVAMDTAGNEIGSFPRYVHYPDYVSPPPPDSLEGFLDDDGVVTLVWKHSEADDVTGYWVSFANDPDSEFVPVNDSLQVLNTFTDTIQVKSLTEKIYYIVTAEDDNYNRSDPSEVLELSRPDLVPPVKPALATPIVTDTAIVLRWENGGSEDVVGYELYRRDYGDTIWYTMEYIDDPLITRYSDTSFSTGDFFEYRMRAVDDAGNFSEYSFPRKASVRFNENSLQVSDFKVTCEESGNGIRLTWSFEPPSGLPEDAREYRFYLFRSYGAENVVQFAEVSQGDTGYKDDGIEPGALHNYTIKVVYNTGHAGPMSQVQSVVCEGK